MWSLIVVDLHPLVEIGLKLLKASIDLPSKCDLVELLQNRFVEAFADPVGLRAFGFGSRVVDILDGEIELILVLFFLATVSPGAQTGPVKGA